MIQLEYDNSHRGYLEFSDSGCTSFTGVVNMEFVGSVAFDEVKTGGLGVPVTAAWGDFSEASYERARVGRWGRRWGGGW